MTEPLPPGPTVEDIARVLAETFTPDGVALALAGRKASFGGERPIDLCMTAEGRERVMAWAQALAEGVFV